MIAALSAGDAGWVSLALIVHVSGKNEGGCELPCCWTGLPAMP